MTQDFCIDLPKIIIEKLSNIERSALTNEIARIRSNVSIFDEAWLKEAYEGNSNLILPLRQVYLGQRGVLQKRIEEGLQESDRTKVGRSAHTLKSSLLAIGVRLTAIEILEREALQGDLQLVQALWQIVVESLDKVEMAIESKNV